MTDSQQETYTIFTYKCGTLAWSGYRIGYRTQEEYTYHPLSSSPYSNAIACSNSDSVWSNLVYDISSVEVSMPGSGQDSGENGKLIGWLVVCR